jgi:uncharacterized protein YbjQ (UPF0145 family)
MTTFTPDGIPTSAVSRLEEMKPGPGKKGFFTSDLSIKEFTLVRQAGFEPLGLVVGSSIYHVGFQKPKLNQSQELETLTQAMYNARDLAMTRMEDEAASLGADGVVGVNLTIGMQQWGENLAEFVAIGTAIKSTSGGHYLTPKGKPFTSDLSGQDFWILIKSGYRPVSFVMGNCVYHVGYQGLKAAFSQMWQNVEMPTYTQAIYTARELALARMQAEGVESGADGIVGASVTASSQGWDSHVLEYFAIGTSVLASTPGLSVPAPSLVLPMFDPPGA